MVHPVVARRLIRFAAKRGLKNVAKDRAREALRGDAEGLIDVVRDAEGGEVIPSGSIGSLDTF